MKSGRVPALRRGDRGATAFARQCHVSPGMLIQCLTSGSRASKNHLNMISAVRKPLDICAAIGRYSPSWSHSLLGQFKARVNAIEF